MKIELCYVALYVLFYVAYFIHEYVARTIMKCPWRYNMKFWLRTMKPWAQPSV